MSIVQEEYVFTRSLLFVKHMRIMMEYELRGTRFLRRQQKPLGKEIHYV